MISARKRPPLTEKECSYIRKLMRRGLSNTVIARQRGCGIDAVCKIARGVYVPAERQTTIQQAKQHEKSFQVVEACLLRVAETRRMQQDYQLPEVLENETLADYLDRLERGGTICNAAIVADGTLNPLPETIDARVAAIRKWNGPKVMATRTIKPISVEVYETSLCSNKAARLAEAKIVESESTRW